MDRWTEQIVAERRHEWLRQGMAEGLKEGIKEGIKEGRKEGMKDAAFSLTVRLLTRKCGSLGMSLEERVRNLPLEQLERLGEDLLDFQDVSDLVEWLDRARESR